MIPIDWQSRELSTEELKKFVNLKELIYNAVKIVSKHWAKIGNDLDDSFMCFESRIFYPWIIEITYFRRETKISKGKRRLRLVMQEQYNRVPGLELTIYFNSSKHESFNFTEKEAQILFYYIFCLQKLMDTTS